MLIRRGPAIYGVEGKRNGFYYYGIRSCSLEMFTFATSWAALTRKSVRRRKEEEEELWILNKGAKYESLKNQQWNQQNKFNKKAILLSGLWSVKLALLL